MTTPFTSLNHQGIGTQFNRFDRMLPRANGWDTENTGRLKALDRFSVG